MYSLGLGFRQQTEEQPVAKHLEISKWKSIKLISMAWWHQIAKVFLSIWVAGRFWFQHNITIIIFFCQLPTKIVCSISHGCICKQKKLLAIPDRNQFAWPILAWHTSYFDKLILKMVIFKLRSHFSPFSLSCASPSPAASFFAHFSYL